MSEQLIEALRIAEALSRKRCLAEPDTFVRRVLGTDVRPFQRRWLDLQGRSKKSLVLAPRGHGKTTMCTVGYSLWKIAREANVRILIASATAFQAETFLRQVRSLIETRPEFGPVYGVKPAKPWTASELGVQRSLRAKEPTVTALGVGGAIIGRHYDVIICDDVVDRDNSATETARRKLSDWFGAVLLPCLEPGGAIHLVGTRWHEKDLYHDLLQNSRIESESAAGGKEATNEN